MHSQNMKLTLCLKDTRKFIFLTPHLARVQFLSNISALRKREENRKM